MYMYIYITYMSHQVIWARNGKNKYMEKNKKIVARHRLCHQSGRHMSYGQNMSAKLSTDLLCFVLLAWWSNRLNKRGSTNTA